MRPCPKCGWKVGHYERSCTMCGHSWAEAAEPLTATQEEPASGKPSREPLLQTMDLAAVTKQADKQVLMGFVALYDGTQPAGAFWPLYSGDRLIGRAGGGAQPDIVINAPSVSARHARVDCNARTGVCVLNDLGSRNGTYVNGVELRSKGARPLEDDDRVRLGEVELVVKLLPRG